MTDPIASLLKEAEDAGVSRRVWTEICLAYSEPWRHYHQLLHVANVVAELKRRVTKNPSTAEYWDELVWAALYHDFVYEPRSSTNETRSADHARFNVPLNLDVQFVCDAILATKHHEFMPMPAHPTDRVRVEALNEFLRADLSVLWSDVSMDYLDWYAMGVRREYDWVDNETYRTRRAEVITKLEKELLSSGILTMSKMQDLTFNVAMELDALKNGKFDL